MFLRYLKHEVPAPSSTAGEPGRFTSIDWHPELALQLMLTTKCKHPSGVNLIYNEYLFRLSAHVLQRIYSWDTFISSREPPYDSGAVAVVDGCTRFAF